MNFIDKVQKNWGFSTPEMNAVITLGTAGLCAITKYVLSKIGNLGTSKKTLEPKAWRWTVNILDAAAVITSIVLFGDKKGLQFLWKALVVEHIVFFVARVLAKKSFNKNEKLGHLEKALKDEDNERVVEIVDRNRQILGKKDEATKDIATRCFAYYEKNINMFRELDNLNKEQHLLHFMLERKITPDYSKLQSKDEKEFMARIFTSFKPLYMANFHSKRYQTKMQQADDLFKLLEFIIDNMDKEELINYCKGKGDGLDFHRILREVSLKSIQRYPQLSEKVFSKVPEIFKTLKKRSGSACHDISTIIQHGDKKFLTNLLTEHLENIVGTTWSNVAEYAIEFKKEYLVDIVLKKCKEKGNTATLSKVFQNAVSQDRLDIVLQIFEICGGMIKDTQFTQLLLYARDKKNYQLIDAVISRFGSRIEPEALMILKDLCLNKQWDSVSLILEKCKNNLNEALLSICVLAACEQKNGDIILKIFADFKGVVKDNEGLLLMILEYALEHNLSFFEVAFSTCRETVRASSFIENLFKKSKGFFKKKLIKMVFDKDDLLTKAIVTTIAKSTNPDYHSILNYLHGRKHFSCLNVLSEQGSFFNLIQWASANFKDDILMSLLTIGKETVTINCLEWPLLRVLERKNWEILGIIVKDFSDKIDQKRLGKVIKICAENGKWETVDFILSKAQILHVRDIFLPAALSNWKSINLIFAKHKDKILFHDIKRAFDCKKVNDRTKKDIINLALQDENTLLYSAIVENVTKGLFEGCWKFIDTNNMGLFTEKVYSGQQKLIPAKPVKIPQALGQTVSNTSQEYKIMFGGRPLLTVKANSMGELKEKIEFGLKDHERQIQGQTALSLIGQGGKGNSGRGRKIVVQVGNTKICVDCLQGQLPPDEPSAPEMESPETVPDIFGNEEGGEEKVKEFKIQEEFEI